MHVVSNRAFRPSFVEQSELERDRLFLRKTCRETFEVLVGRRMV